jgi:hypothetical protein
MIFHVFHFQRLGQGPKEPTSLRPDGRPLNFREIEQNGPFQNKCDKNCQ